MRMKPLLLLLLAHTVAVAADSPGVAINQERLARLKEATMPKFDRPLQFDTPEADAVLAALEVFPPDNPWNIPVDAWPVAPNSKAMIALIGGAKPLRYNPDMGFVLVPPDQKKIDVRLSAYSGKRRTKCLCFSKRSTGTVPRAKHWSALH